MDVAIDTVRSSVTVIRKCRDRERGASASSPCCDQYRRQNAACPVRNRCGVDRLVMAGLASIYARLDGRGRYMQLGQHYRLDNTEDSTARRSLLGHSRAVEHPETEEVRSARAAQSRRRVRGGEHVCADERACC